MGGDLPCSVAMTAAWRECLPRARGFTDRVVRGWAFRLVSSPCAGVYLSCSAPVGLPVGVFPVRGGLPPTLIRTLSGAVCLPRARGFTFVPVAVGVRNDVSSPCAGVHRTRASRSLLPGCVFPVRGGSPSSDRILNCLMQCLPRARGFTEV